MDARLQALTAAIYEEVRHPFNINSPQQLGKVLFEELGPARAGPHRQDEELFNRRRRAGDPGAAHPVVQQVLDYRQIAKLKGTYVDALPLLVDSAGRVHTTFNPAGAATGRLSSSDPNLQNIPIRTELGPRHPRGFRAATGLDAALRRLLADRTASAGAFLLRPVLIDAFRHNEDIHTRTAAEVFGVPPLMVTPEMRRGAKAVNFGIVYGQTAFGLAAQIGVSREEAEPLYPQLLRALRRREKVDRTHHGRGAPSRLHADLARPPPADSRHPVEESQRAVPSPNARRSTRRCRALPPT